MIFCLENGLIDGALVTRMSKNKPLSPEPFIATKREEFLIHQVKILPSTVNMA
jgi:coenzyme F420 hydrogenase subunit beta